MIGPKSPQVRVALWNYAQELKGRVSNPAFEVRAEWREEFYRRLVASKVEVDKQLFDAARPTIDKWLSHFVTRFAFGDAEPCAGLEQRFADIAADESAAAEDGDEGRRVDAGHGAILERLAGSRPSARGSSSLAARGRTHPTTVGPRRTAAGSRSPATGRTTARRGQAPR